MKFRTLLPLACVLTAFVASASAATPTRLWPATAPGETTPLPAEADVTKPSDNIVAGRPVIRLGNVSDPTLTIYQAPADKNTGATIVVFPGGGYHIVALDLEGTEVCEWLNERGINAVLVKYRVPRREGRAKHAAPLQDAQRAIGLVRQQAPALGLDPNRIGVLGFSAGGHLAATVSNNYGRRTYPEIDDADRVSCRPDFTVLIYPAYLTDPEKNDTIAPELPLAADTPPTFLVMTQDDPVRAENAVHYYLGLKRAGVPAELHLYPKGGHGYGLRRTGNSVADWPELVARWMAASGWIQPSR